MKILKRQKFSMPFNVAVFVNSTAGLVPPARNGQIEEGSAGRHCDDSQTSFRGVNESSNERRTILRTSDISSRPAAGTKYCNLFSIRNL